VSEPSYYLFLDLETAGLAYDAPIFEVGCILTEFTAGQFAPLDEYHGVVAWHHQFKAKLDPFAQSMHEANGLLQDMGFAEASDEETDLPIRDNAPLFQHDQNISNVIGLHLGEKWKGKVHLAGSGVSHFDLRRVNDQMPKVAEWLHWRPLDVGQLEEWRKLCRQNVYEDAAVSIDPMAPTKTHRAMDDIRYHLTEANWYVAEAGA
jgi:oligoribonuclease (3'-5' exoribonuclease)